MARKAPRFLRSDVHDVANELIRSHRFPRDVKLHRQRLTARGVPVLEVHYQWGKETRRFWVFGLDRQVYAPSFPLSIARLAIVASAVVAAVGLVVALVLSAG